MIFIFLFLAMITDAAFGEPKIIWDHIPHPAKLMGRFVAWLDRLLNKGKYRKAKGILVTFILVLVAGRIGFWLLLSPRLAPIMLVLVPTILIAQKSLTDHVSSVADGLRAGLPEGRKAIAKIVGRDPEALDETAIARAAIESAAENFSDGVIAPIFWFLLAGLPGIIVYKMINTADSMIAHHNEKYQEFGWATAKLDDLLNFIPSRLSGLIFCMLSGKLSIFKIMFRDAKLHKSPSAGWPEAAMAARLGVALAGPRMYGGVQSEDAYMNGEGRKNATPNDIDAAVRMLWQAWGGVLIMALAVAAVILLV